MNNYLKGVNVNKNKGRGIKVGLQKNNEIFVRIVGACLAVVLSLNVFVNDFLVYASENGDYVCSEIEDSIYATLIENGYSQAGACGILGNISVENPDFQADLYANNGRTYGLFQWTEAGERQSRLKKWCNNRSIHYDRPEGQIAYALYELGGGDSIAKRINEYMLSTEDPRAAATAFAVGFERCIGATGNKEADGVYTGYLFPEFRGHTYQALNRRMDRAQGYYDKYSVADVNPGLAFDVEKMSKVGIVSEKEDLLFEVVPTIEITVGKRNLWPYRILSLVIGYMFGCILGASIIAISIKRKGSVNFSNKTPSIRNVLTYIGIKETILSILIDVIKFYAAVALSFYISKGLLKSELIPWVGIGIILGNDFPFWRKFKGGMGIVVSTLMICAYMPIWGFYCCLIGLGISVITKSFPFGALFISIAAVPYAYIYKGFIGGLFITIVMLLVLVRHYRFVVKFVSKELLHKHYSRYIRKPTR